MQDFRFRRDRPEDRMRIPDHANAEVLFISVIFIPQFFAQLLHQSDRNVAPNEF